MKVWNKYELMFVGSTTTTILYGLNTQACGSSAWQVVLIFMYNTAWVEGCSVARMHGPYIY